MAKWRLGVLGWLTVMLAGACAGSGGTANPDGSASIDGPPPDSAQGSDGPAGSDGLGGSSGPCVPVQLAVGSYYNCVRSRDGGVWCWGKNDFGQIGDGTKTNRHLPVRLSLSGAADVKVAGARSCARKTDGTLWCWGWNAKGEVGDGTLIDRNSPVQVAALAGEVADFVMGVSHTCAWKKDGTIWCWGGNDWGELVSGSVAPQTAPVPFPAIGFKPVEVALGGGFICARKEDGTVWCWGYNLYGQAGDGTLVDRTTPGQVMRLSGAAQIAASGSHTCARKTDGTLWCWGANWLGQIGDGTTENRAVAVQVTALGTMVADVPMPALHSCARKTDGTLWCWGWNGDGQLGIETPDGFSLTPSQVESVGALSSVGLGMQHTCVLETDGVPWCWGSNEFGQLGDDTTVSSKDPTGPIGCP